jgi:Domain of unknown function (DUF4294)
MSQNTRNLPNMNYLLLQRRLALVALIWIGILQGGFAQQSSVATLPARRDTSKSPSAWLTREIINGDTTYMAVLYEVRVKDARIYKDLAERDRLRRYRRYAANVYPYAVQAVELRDETLRATADMNRRQERRYMRTQKKAFKEDFEEKLKGLYKTEGYILIKMIERNTGKNCYDIIKEARGPVVATYWNSMGKIWGYDLKEGYKHGADPLLDEVLLDYDFGDSYWKY